MVLGWKSSLIQPSMVKLNDPLPEELRCSVVSGLFAKLCLARHLDIRGGWLRHPILVLLVNLIILVRALLVLFLLPEHLTRTDKMNLLYTGDLSIAINLRLLYNSLLLTITLTSLLYHWIHYWGTQPMSKPLKQNIIRQKVAPFVLLTGHATPHQIGLRSRTLCASFVRQAHLVTCWLPAVPSTIGIGATVGSIGVFFYAFILLDASITTTSVLVATIIHSLGYAFMCEYFLTASLYHLLYLNLICKYIRIQMMQLNKALSIRLSRDPLGQIKHSSTVTRDLNRMQWQMNTYNRYFWSQVILAVVMCLMLNLCLLLITALFGNILFVVRIIVVLFGISVATVFALLLYSISRVNQMAHVLYRRFHSFHAHNYSRCASRPERFGCFARLVFFNKFKFQTIIAQFKPKKFAFTCGSLFAVNFRIFLEIFLTMVIVFLKMLQIKSRI